MSSDKDPVKGWLERLAMGDLEAAQPLWDLYFERLVRLAVSRLPDHARRAYDEEDVALSAFRSFCHRARQGQLPDLSDADDLWRLLVVFTARKAISYMRRENRQKRGGGQVQGESVFWKLGADADASGGMAAVLTTGPTPELALVLVEEYENLLATLDDPQMRSIAVLKLEGYSADEIADRLGTSRRTVDRKLRIIRMTWDEVARSAEGVES
jgi:DNA-directed RNA polymerase specialized sigma24 family protein